MNSLLYSIRGFKIGDPAFTFDYESKGFDRSVWTKVEGEPTPSSESKIHFIASKNIIDENFFRNITDEDPKYNFSNLQVYINGELTDQVANNISASANDDIVIKATSGKYPWFSINGRDCIKSIKEPLPLMHQANGDKITNFNYYFYACSSLTSIPTGLFDNNTQVTDFGGCFADCSNLTSIPTGLFDKNTQVTSFSECFYNCSGLTSIPAGLFDKNTRVTYFSECFYGCSRLTVNVQIGSTASSVRVIKFAEGTKEKGTVFCREGSAAYTAFSESTNANVNVLTY